MKKTLKLASIILVSILFFNSCETDDSELIIESTIEQKENTIDSNQKSKVRLTNCDIIGSKIACPNQTLSYTYISDSSNSNVTWTHSNGISIISGQGTNTAKFYINSGFTFGYIKALGQGSEVCSETKYISCKDVPITCGSVNGITQLNILGNDSVKFFIPNRSLIINSGWSNPSYFWEFVCHSTGYNVWSYDEQPYVDLSNCSGFWDVKVTVTVTDSQGNRCSFSRTEDFHPGGTGGF